MDPALTTSYLEYGITGVLALVLVGVGIWLTWYAKEQQAFIRELVKDLHTNSDDWRSLVEQSITANALVASAMNEITNTLEQTHTQHERSIQTLNAAHTEIQRGITELNVTARTLERKHTLAQAVAQ